MIGLSPDDRYKLGRDPLEGQRDRNHRGGREMRPGRLERVYAFWPWAHQNDVGTVLAAVGVADRQSVNRDCLRVNQSAHGQTLSGPELPR